MTTEAQYALRAMPHLRNSMAISEFRELLDDMESLLGDVQIRIQGSICGEGVSYPINTLYVGEWKNTKIVEIS